MSNPGPDPERDRRSMLGSSSRRRRRARRRQQIALFGVPVVLVLAALGGWLWLRDGGGDGEPGGEPTAPAADTAPAPSQRADSPRRALPDTFELPPLEASDSVIRVVAGELSSQSAWASWLVPDDLVRRFVGSVVSVSTGSRPASRLAFMKPDESFAVRGSQGDTVIDPASYRRYDRLTAVFAGLDPEGTARLYRRLHPLFEEVHRELGFEEGTFDDAMARAMGNVLAVEVPDGPLEVVRDETVWDFRDPEIEGRSAVARQLVRMGPENARRIQAKVRELARALEIQPVARGNP